MKPSSKVLWLLVCLAAFPTCAGARNEDLDPESPRLKPPRVYAFRSLEELTPVPSGAGLLVFPPVLPKNPVPSLGDFSEGAAQWLHLHAAGQPSLGQSVSWSMAERAMRTLGIKDGRLTRDQALAVGGPAGTTHVAVGTVSGVGGKLRLDYQLYESVAPVKKGQPTWKAIGAPFTASGSMAQITVALKGIAGKMVQRLGGKVELPIPAISEADLTLLGKAAGSKRGDLTGVELLELDKVTEREPTAGSIVMTTRWLRHRAPSAATVKKMIATAPKNPLVWDVVGEETWIDYLPYIEEIAKLGRIYPNNVEIAFAEYCSLQWDGYRLYRQAPASERAIRCAPKNPHAWMIFGNSVREAQSRVNSGLLDAGKDQELDAFYKYSDKLQLAAYSRALKLAPQEPYTWFAYTGVTEGKARRDATWKMLKLSPQEWGFWEHAFGVFSSEGQKSADWIDFLKLVEETQHPTAADTRQMSRLLKTYGQPKLAGVLAKKAIEQAKGELAVSMNDADAHYALGMSYHEMNDYAHAIPELSEALAIQPSRADRRAELGEMLLINRNYAEAAKEYQVVIRDAPSYFKGHHGLGRAYVYLGKAKEAEDPLREALCLWPTHGVNVHFLGEALFLQGRREDAMPWLEYSERLSPWISGNYTRLSYLYLEKSRWDDAADQARRGIERAPQVPDLHWALGKALFQKGDNAGALASAREAKRLNADHPAFPLLEGEVLFKLGKTGEAIAAWESVLKLDRGRNSPDTQTARALLAKARGM